MAHILGLYTKLQAKTRIMHDVNISFNQFESYAILLESKILLTQEENRYVTTAKEVQFVNAFNQLQTALNGSDLMSSPHRLIKARQEPKKPTITF